MSATTRVSREVQAAPERVFRALVTAAEIVRWRFPADMSCEVHHFDARVGGRFRVSLTYDDPASESGKSSVRTDTYAGRFVELAPGERVVEELEFETDDPTLAGRMVITTTVTATTRGSLVETVHEGVPDGVRPEDNELGTRMALDNLAALVESG